MLQKQAVDNKTFSLLQKLQSIPELKEMRLVGGTALALQIGHRISVDLDFFGTFNSSIVKAKLFKNLFQVVEMDCAISI